MRAAGIAWLSPRRGSGLVDRLGGSIISRTRKAAICGSRSSRHRASYDRSAVPRHQGAAPVLKRRGVSSRQLRVGFKRVSDIAGEARRGCRGGRGVYLRSLTTSQVPSARLRPGASPDFGPLVRADVLASLNDSEVQRSSPWPTSAVDRRSARASCRTVTPAQRRRGHPLIVPVGVTRSDRANACQLLQERYPPIFATGAPKRAAARKRTRFPSAPSRQTTHA